MDLTIFERKLLFNQYEILKHIDPSEREFYERAQQILEDGYRPLYNNLFQSIDETGLTVDDVTFVYDVLSMYEALQNFETNYPEQKHLVEKNRFFGFDYNNSREIKLAGFVRFCVEKEKKWEYLNIVNYNSHMPAETTYRRMLSAWLALPNHERFSLTADQVQKIVLERIHPSNRKE